jgi:hypothetical protein
MEEQRMENSAAFNFLWVFFLISAQAGRGKTMIFGVSLCPFLPLRAIQ